MNIHEREFFVSLIRIGKIFIESNNIELEIRPPTIKQTFLSNKVYQEAYNKAFAEEFMTEEDLKLWMLENGLWSPFDEKQIENLNSTLENIKVDIYENRSDLKKVKKNKANLKFLEMQLASLQNKKYTYYNNTCEGIASSEKLLWTIKNTTYRNNKKYDFSKISLEFVMDEFHNSILSEKKLRELARNDPWKSIWITRKNSKINLFNNPKKYELTYNQKNLLVWSQMYDNIQESVDCPEKDVIDDDDMLDGWFIVQNRKREKEKFQQELDSSIKSDKIKNAKEVFVMSSPEDKKRTEKIEQLNDISAKIVKAKNFEYLKQKNEE